MPTYTKKTKKDLEQKLKKKKEKKVCDNEERKLWQENLFEGKKYKSLNSQVCQIKLAL